MLTSLLVPAGRCLGYTYAHREFIVAGVRRTTAAVEAGSARNRYATARAATSSSNRSRTVSATRRCGPSGSAIKMFCARA